MGMLDKFKEQLNFKEAYSNFKNEQKAISKGLAGRFDYLGGFNKLIAGEIIVWRGETDYSLILQHNTGNKKYEIKITGIEWDEKGQRSAGKAAAGAIIGGVLTGGLGAGAGAAIGGKKTDNSLAVIKYRDGDFEGEIYFRTDNKQYQHLTRLL
ncbi:hypothetical protein [Marinicrinis sediminis]|uniref:Uncharacterized protein n=1 Tax=Marinicrinis sediminis TaxID=1652465 RepID=A0ABW5RB13_9BACL